MEIEKLASAWKKRVGRPGLRLVGTSARLGLGSRLGGRAREQKY